MRLQAALCSHLGLHAPRLVRLLGRLLAVQRQWTRREKFCDPFATALHLDALRAATQPVPEGGGGGGSGEGSGAGAGGNLPDTLDGVMATSLGSGSGDEDEGGGMDVEEEHILQLMEVLEVPRSAAIVLLMQHEGDIEAAVMSALGSL